MNKLTQALMEELTVEYVKVGSLQIPESVVISWVIMLLLVVGPPLEERYGSGRLLGCMFITALTSGLVQFFLFPGTALLGASGIVFMCILLSSLSGMHGGAIPLTLILVAVFYLGGEWIDAVTVQDNVSHLTHIVGGLCGAILGFAMRK